MQKTIAIIKKNKIQFDNLGEYVTPLLYEKHTKTKRQEIKESINNYIWSRIEQHILFVDVHDQNEFYECLAKEAQLNFPDHCPSECTYFTENSYSTPNNLYEIVYWKPSWNDYVNSSKDITIMNDIGCLANLSHNIIENSCVIISNKYDLNKPKNIDMTNITKNDIIKIIKRRYFQTAILIEEKSLTKYYFQDLKYLVNKLFDTDNIDIYPFTNLDFNLKFYFNKNATQYVNQIATRINGKHRIYGKTLVVHEMDENIYTNIGIKEIKRLNVLSFSVLQNRETNNDDDNEIPFWNKYIILVKKLNEWNLCKNKCISCGNQNSKITCDRCYRVQYCSDICYDNYKDIHIKECL